jgi:hypothetical protein
LCTVGAFLMNANSIGQSISVYCSSSSIQPALGTRHQSNVCSNLASQLFLTHLGCLSGNHVD